MPTDLLLLLGFSIVVLLIFAVGVAFALGIGGDK
jgi:hypothetical protein